MDVEQDAAEAPGREPATPEGKGAANVLQARPRVQRLFVDETKTTFFRRLSYSPDGKLLFTPAGRHKDEDGTEQSTLYIFRTSMPSTYGRAQPEETCRGSILL